jgi:Putative MetA-pathway of phenol degradation
MKNDALPKKPAARLRWLAAATLALAVLCPPPALAQVPARFYWKSLSGGNGVPVIFNSLSGNTNPFDPSNRVTPDANFDATMALAGWAHTYTLFDRSAMGAVILPMGRVSGGVAGITETSRGFGDPMLEFNYNLIGPKAQKTIPDVLRYEPGFSLDLLVDLMLPIGEYDSKQTVNLGQNRWYGRLGMPVVWQLGPWVPGRRTTLELLPAVWLFGDNTDFDNGKTLKTDPMFQLDAHLTRDFTQNIWGGLDLSWYKGGGSTINGVAGGKLNNVGVGLTLGYTVNENLNLTVGYKSTVNDSAPTDMRMDGFMVTLVFGWHPIVEGMRRLKSE